MDGTIALNLFLVAVFIGLTAFFVGAEFAILKVRMTRIDQLIAEGNKKALTAKKVTQDLDYYLSACQLGITITALVLGALGEPTVERMLHPLFERFEVPEALSTVLSYAIALSVITFLHVVIGELAPKTLAIQYAERMTLLLAPPLYGFGKLMYPFIYALNGSAQLLLKLFGVKPAGHDTAHSEEEIRLIVTQSYEGGEINQTELDYLKNIFSFDERKVQDIMIPKSKIVTVPENASVEEILQSLDSYVYTRYPVEDSGQPGHYKGVINTKEILTHLAAGRAFVMNEFIYDMPEYPEDALIQDILSTMQKDRIHMAAVVDSRGATIGMVTMEDILEEIVGDIQDEVGMNPKPPLRPVVKKMREELPRTVR
ncbi:hypothetical protein E6C60_2234 [Paenibacillus algicola]|uniref:Transporter associated domain protein n=1 Tax=Paenibacillus algicola TaxID=2565926 RepID=A0A4P8XJW0_9BACL|nr:hemolysin family protein [Paenibacillus algicola]QCT02947.1 hypothetical protein E6C60_2234 [Paenibacillus algicola]